MLKVHSFFIRQAFQAVFQMECSSIANVFSKYFHLESNQQSSWSLSSRVDTPASCHFQCVLMRNEKIQHAEL